MKGFVKGKLLTSLRRGHTSQQKAMSINLGVGPPPSLESVSNGSRAFPSTTSIASNTTTTTIVKNPETNSRKASLVRRHLNRGPLPKHDPTENTEQLRIRQSFSSTSFLSMRSLPSNLKPGNISKALTKRKEKRGEENGENKKKSSVGGGGVVPNGRVPRPKDFLTKQKMKLFSHSNYMEVRAEQKHIYDENITRIYIADPYLTQPPPPTSPPRSLTIIFRATKTRPR